MLFQSEDTALARWLAVKNFPGDWRTEVEASREWIGIKWEPLETMRESTEATQHRSTRTPCKPRYPEYQRMITATKHTTKSIIKETPVLYYERHGVSRCTKDFLKTFVIHGMPETRQFAFRREIVTSMIDNRWESPSQLSLRVSILSSRPDGGDVSWILSKSAAKLLKGR
jgi:hypothetical protein